MADIVLYLIDAYLNTKCDLTFLLFTACEFPYYGRNCQSKCNCTGRGAKECHPVRGCVCYAGWEGENCDNDVNECQTRDKTCIDVFKYCENTLGSFACKCRQGYEPVGDNCKGTCRHCPPAEMLLFHRQEH